MKWLSVCSVFFLLAISSWPASASAALYRWIDETGTVHISDDPTDIPQQYRTKSKIAEESDAPAKGLEIPFEKTGNGLIIVDAVLNRSVKAKMVFDTGADIVVVTERLSKKLDQDVTGGGETVMLHTNCGEVKGVSFRVNRIDLGSARKDNVKAVITPDELALSGFEGLLGLSFLGDFKITVDYQKGFIRLVK